MEVYINCCHKLGCIRQSKVKKYISKNSGGCKSEISVPEWSRVQMDSNGGFCFGWQIDPFRLYCLHDWEEKIDLLMCLVIRTLLFDKCSTHMISLNIHYSNKCSVYKHSNTAIWELNIWILIKVFCVYKYFFLNLWLCIMCLPSANGG